MQNDLNKMNWKFVVVVIICLVMYVIHTGGELTNSFFGLVAINFLHFLCHKLPNYRFSILQISDFHFENYKFELFLKLQNSISFRKIQ